MKIKYKTAFTLAETLIALGVIGVVAVLTLPTLIQKQQEKITVQKLKASYSIIQQAFTLAMAENGTPDMWDITGNQSTADTHIQLANKFVPHLKIIKNCIGKDDQYTKQNCNAVGKTYRLNYYSSIVLSNGTSVTFRVLRPTCDNNYFINNLCGFIYIDTNGLKGPNKYGYDSFTFFLTKDKIVPLGIKGGSPTFKRNCDITASNPNTDFGATQACTAWVLYNENQDYLHCSGLDWDIKTKCK